MCEYADMGNIRGSSKTAGGNWVGAAGASIIDPGTGPGGTPAQLRDFTASDQL